MLHYADTPHNKCGVSVVRLRAKWSEWRDSNSRPYGPEPYALPNCATPRKGIIRLLWQSSRTETEPYVWWRVALTEGFAAHLAGAGSAPGRVLGMSRASVACRNPNCATPRKELFVCHGRAPERRPSRTAPRSERRSGPLPRIPLSGRASRAVRGASERM